MVDCKNIHGIYFCAIIDTSMTVCACIVMIIFYKYLYEDSWKKRCLSLSQIFMVDALY